MQYNTNYGQGKPSIYNEVEAYFMGDVIASIWQLNIVRVLVQVQVMV